jgi:hypothetical protein
VIPYQHGDRVRLETTDPDGLPLVRYGFVGGVDEQQVVVLLDGDFAADMVVDLSQLQPVTITNVELRLHGADLLEDPRLRHGLVSLWSAEAEEAGLEIGSLHCMGDGVRDSNDGYSLAELMAGGEQYVLRAVLESYRSDVVRVRADRSDRWDV